jgi:hypothetical protein
MLKCIQAVCSGRSWESRHGTLHACDVPYAVGEVCLPLATFYMYFQCRCHRGIHNFGILAHAEEFRWAERSCTPNRFGVMLQSPTFSDTFLEQYLERFSRADTSPQSKVLNVGVVAKMLILEVSAFPADAERFQYARK